MPVVKLVRIKARVAIASSQVARWPPDGRLADHEMLSGFWCQNLSDDNVYIDWDADADPNISPLLRPNEDHDFDRFVVKKNITFYCGSTSAVELVGYVRTSQPLVMQEGAPEPFLADFSPVPLIADVMNYRRARSKNDADNQG